MTQDNNPRFVSVTPPEVLVDINTWRDIIKANFPDLLFPAEVCLSVVSQILIRDITNPFALVLVDVPSAGKTITINFFSEIEGLTYATDKFTPASFVSNAANVATKKLDQVDMLPRIRYKMLLVRDLAPLFGERDDDLLKSMGVLTRVLDGEGLKTDSGIHGQRSYVGEYLFMLLAGSTPIQPRVWKTMGNLGSRLFFLNMNSRDKSEAQLAAQLKNHSHKDREMVCRIITEQMLYSLWAKYPNGVEWDRSKEKDELLGVISRCAQLLARLRGVINLWQENTEDGAKHNYSTPVIEKPDRINQQYYNLCRAHALVCGRTELTLADLRLPIELSIDSCPPVRARLFRTLLEHEGHMTTSEVMAALNVSKPTALKEMKTLEILGICVATDEDDGMPGRPESQIELKDDLWWFASQECWDIRQVPMPKRPNNANKKGASDGK